ncbi:MAG: hypothetical protein ACTSU5_16970 [Promethearchaeota archaeon]
MAELDDISNQVDEMGKLIDDFTQSFTGISFTLIAKMAEITDSLSRISEAAEILPKLKVMNAESEKFMKKLETTFSMVLQRLDKLSMDGGTLPTGPAPSREEPASKVEGASLDSPAPVGLDSPAPVGLDSPAPVGLDSPAPTTHGAETVMGVPTSREEDKKEIVAGVEVGVEVEPTPSAAAPSTAEPVATTPVVELPGEGREEVASELDNMFKEMATLKPESEKASTQPGSELPVLQIRDPSNVVHRIFQDLSKAANACTSYRELGEKVSQAKDNIANQIRFHAALFDMIKIANSYFKRKDELLDDGAKREIQAQIEDWYSAITS